MMGNCCDSTDRKGDHNTVDLAQSSHVNEQKPLDVEEESKDQSQQTAVEEGETRAL
jgi:hypothetical protein